MQEAMAVLGDSRFWAFSLEMVPKAGERAVSIGRLPTETVLKGKAKVASSRVSPTIASEDT